MNGKSACPCVCSTDEKEAAIVLASHSLCYARRPVQIIVTISTMPTANMSIDKKLMENFLSWRDDTPPPR